MTDSKKIKQIAPHKEHLINCLQQIIIFLEEGCTIEAISIAVDTMDALSSGFYEWIDPIMAFKTLRISQLERALSEALNYLEKGVDMGVFDHGAISGELVLKRLNMILNHK